MSLIGMVRMFLAAVQFFLNSFLLKAVRHKGGSAE
jgi:hypothetical protein